MSGSLCIRKDRSANGRSPQAWGVLSKFGNGRVKTEQRDDLRSSLMRELEEKGLTAGLGSTAAAEEEVDKFLASGRISGTNMDRLERRVFRRMRVGAEAGIPNTARDLHSMTSEFTVGSRSMGSQTPRPRSVEGSAYRVSREGGTRSCTPGGVLGIQDLLDEGNPKWSELANYAKLQGEKAKVDQRSQVKATQEKMRLDLERQMHEKEMRKSSKFEEDKKDIERQKVELQAWQEAEVTIAEEQKRVALEVRKEREMQNLVVNAIKQDERRKKQEDEDNQMKRNMDAVEEEKKVALEKKNKQKGTMQLLMAEWAEDRSKRSEEKRKQANEEQAKVTEYNEMLDRQEARNKKNIPVARMPKGEYKPPDKAERRRVERQFDEQVMHMVRAANVKALEDEKNKVESRSRQLQNNQEFLMQQKIEKDNTMKMRREEKQQQKERVQAETAEFWQSEKDRVEKQRMKNVQYRLELDRQISTRTTSSRVRRAPNEDNMSQAEVAMNRRLLEEARSTLSSWNPRSPGSKQMTPTL